MCIINKTKNDEANKIKKTRSLSQCMSDSNTGPLKKNKSKKLKEKNKSGGNKLYAEALATPFLIYDELLSIFPACN